jgi:hypothetical protein
MELPERRRLRDAYRYPDFTPSGFVFRYSDDPVGWVIELSRRSKGGSVRAVAGRADVMTSAGFWYGTWTAEAGTSTCSSDFGG